MNFKNFSFPQILCIPVFSHFILDSSNQLSSMSLMKFNGESLQQSQQFWQNNSLDVLFKEHDVNLLFLSPRNVIMKQLIEPITNQKLNNDFFYRFGSTLSETVSLLVYGQSTSHKITINLNNNIFRIHLEIFNTGMYVYFQSTHVD